MSFIRIKQGEVIAIPADSNYESDIQLDWRYDNGIKYNVDAMLVSKDSDKVFITIMHPAAHGRVLLSLSMEDAKNLLNVLTEEVINLV